MLSRLANVLQELSGEEGLDGDSQGTLVPQLPGGGALAPGEAEVPEEALERLAHLEQLVVQLKELIRDKDTQLVQKDTEVANKDAQLKSEKDEAEARFTKLKLQAKAKMASLNKQITELKGSAVTTQSPDSSFSGTAVEDELQELKDKLSKEEAAGWELRQQLQATEQLLHDKEAVHAEQVQKLQAVVCEKDVRFQEQIQRHEEELIGATVQSQNEGEIQQALHAAQRRCEELEEALKSRSEMLEVLQEEVNSADQQKQILTAQFRQMDQELAEATKLREEERRQWADQMKRADEELAALRSSMEVLEGERAGEAARQQSELREAERIYHEALEKEKMEVARLEGELALTREAELAAVQACRDGSEKDRAEITRLESKLASMRETQARGNAERKTETLEMDLASLREEQERTSEMLVEVWKHLQALASDDAQSCEETAVPADLSLILDAVRVINNQVAALKDKLGESEEQRAELTHTMETLQEQLDKKSSEQEEEAARVQVLQQQIITSSERNNMTEPLTQESSEAHILVLEQQLIEKDNELVTLRESLRQAQDLSSSEVTSSVIFDQTLDQDRDTDTAACDSSASPPDLMEDTQEEDTTIVAEDTSVLAMSADNESSPELIGNQPESPAESKGTSSDEMVASSDSEVAHSSWTLLEATNQDGGQEWPSLLQDFGHMQLQSWEATSMEQETSMVQVESSSSVVARETVHVHVTQQSSSSPSDAGVSSGQVFAQALAEELQKRYSELLAEVQRLRDAAAGSQEKISRLEEEARSLTAEKEEAVSQINIIGEDLRLAREEMDKASHMSSSATEKHSVEIQLLEDQIEILNTASISKAEKIQSLQSDLETTHQALTEKDSQVRMLSAQLEDTELLSSELERKLHDMENRMMEYSQSSDLNNESLSQKESEISDLQLRLNQKENEMMELNDSMSAKLLQVEEEKFQIDREVKKLKEQMVELEKGKDEKEQVSSEDSSADEELGSLRKEKGQLETQLANTKKKLQAALVQRKELMRKVADFEVEAKKWKEQGESSKEENVPEGDETSGQYVKEMEAKLQELEEALRAKVETVESLELKINQQDEVIAETFALNRRLSEEAEKSEQASDILPEKLQSQVASLEAECEALQKKVQEAQESRKETIRKAKDKDRHHREQLNQQKEEYGELMARFEAQSGEREELLSQLRDLEERVSSERVDVPQQAAKQVPQNAEKPAAGDWVQEDWVDFAASEPEPSQPRSGDPAPPSAEVSDVRAAEVEESLKALQEEIQTVHLAHAELEKQLQDALASLSQKEAEVQDLGEELRALREKERQIDSLLEEIADLKEKQHQAESHAGTLKAEMEAATEAAALSESSASIAELQAEVENFKQFIDNKNRETMELSQQLSEQNLLIHSMQDTVSEKDQLIASLQSEVKLEQEKSQRLEVEVPQKDSETKVLQRKLQAALISRKETMKENKGQKEQLASTEKIVVELQQKVGAAENELEKLRAERLKLIEEVDRALLENQSLGSSCESLKLAMEGIVSEKNACKREAELAQEEATRVSREWGEKVQGMKDEYETLLKSYENVSDEAERVRRVLGAARQERQELAARVRTHEGKRQEAEQRAEEAQKEVDLVKDKMRKFAKTKQQKILELEEENEGLREMQEKPVRRGRDGNVTAEVQRLEEEMETLKVELETTAAERDSFGKQVGELREQLSANVETLKREMEATATEGDAFGRTVEEMKEQMKEKKDDEIQDAPVVEEVIVAQTSDATVSRSEPDEIQDENKENLATQDEEIVSASAPETHAEPTGEEVKEEMVEVYLEDTIKKMEAAFNSEKGLWQQQDAELRAELASLERDLQETRDKLTLASSLEKSLEESKEREKSLMEEGEKRESQFKELLRSLEMEKDNLEERLMNQLAQLNGSIADYQQEASDYHQHLTELQREVESLERERAELEAEARSESDRACRLEEDMRQAQRERAEAEAECGKQRELEQQLRSVQRVKEGSQSRARQLEELLREKQLEVRQLQNDSIQYQERISELGREGKALLHNRDELKGKLEQSQLQTSSTQESLKSREEELVGLKSQLEDVQKELSEALTEKETLEKSLVQREASLKAEAEQTLDSVRFRLGAELKEIELRLEEAYRDRDKEEEATLEAREMADGAERRSQETQARLDESLARLAAFSRCMSSLQDDRDRVLDEARQWETRFNGALQGKEAEVREAEARAKNLVEQLQKETALKEELQLSVDRLVKADQDWQLRLEEKEQKATESQAALEEEKSQRQQTTAELTSAQNEVGALTEELQGLRVRVKALDEAVARLQGEVDMARMELREREAEERRLCLNLEQLETDLRSSKALTESLQVEVHKKEKREVELLGEKEQAVAQAAEEARKEADSRAQEAEKELEQKREEVRDLGEKLRKAEEESNNRKTRLDSFMKAMGSLQDDRDRVLNMYKQLEEKHLQVMMEKDGLIQEAAGENNGLKEEMRSLLVQRDDLYAERAKLSAQLHGYREELNQVLSMKDSQHKQRLAAQRERIASLEKQCEELENQLKGASRAAEAETEAARLERETPSRAPAAPQAVDAPGAEVEKLREQLQAARQQAESLEETLRKERREQEGKSKELAELRWEGGVMRTESESAQERVAELARDLLAVEQRLLEEREATTQLRAENQSFAKAMASLQESRDQEVNRVQELNLRLEELSKAGGPSAQSSPGGSSGEVWGLKNALQALQNDRERLLEQLRSQTSEMNMQQTELARLGAGELIKVSQELYDEKRRNDDMLGVLTELEGVVETGKHEIETLRLERIDWMAQAEQLKQQTLTTLSERDQQLRQLSAMLAEARSHQPKLQQEHYQREGTEKADSPPGAPQERSSQLDVHAYMAEVKELQRRLDEETQQRIGAEEQLMATQDQLKRHSPAKWRSAAEEDQSETAVFIEPPEGAVTRSRRGGPGLMRMLRVAFCSRQRTPLLISLYLLTVHVLLLMCLGGFL